MTVDEVQRRASLAKTHFREGRPERTNGVALRLYHSVLRTLLDHDISDDARALIEAALEAER